MDYLLVNTDLKPINETLDSIFQYINNLESLNNMIVLDIGIGNGNSSIPMEKHYKFKAYYGIEPLSNIYDIFIKLHKKHNSKIKSYNMNLEKFASETKKKFDIIILRNVIHLIGINELMSKCRKIVKKNAFIIIQNLQAEPIGWGDHSFVKKSINFNKKKWLKFENQLKLCYYKILNNKYLYKYIKDDKYIFFMLKTDNGFD